MAKNNNIYSGEFGVNNQIYFCGVPFRLDSYSGCSHVCRYCFARSAELTNLSHLQRQKKVTESIIPADPAQLKRKLVIALDQGLKRSDINIEWLRHRVPIHWGGMSDPFQPCENRYKVTKQWLEYLNWYNYPVAISTKGTALATTPEYLQLLKEGNYVVQVSLITDDPILQQLEPGVPSPEERLKHIQIMVDAGLTVMVRIQPLIPNTVVEHNLGEYITRLGKIGVKHVLTEGYKVQVRQNDWKNEIWQLFPEAIQEYQQSDIRFEGFELLLSSARKYKYIQIAKQAAHEAGMTYGAADNDMRIYGDTICCCGLDNIKGFENFWRYQSSQAAVIAKEKGFVTLEDMQQFWDGGKQSMDSGNILNNEMYQEVYGYPKGKAKERDRNKDGGLMSCQAGKMRTEDRAGGIRYTAKYCVDWMWNNGGSCSPEEIVGLKKDNVDGKVAYRWEDPENSLKQKSQVQQISLL